MTVTMPPSEWVASLLDDELDEPERIAAARTLGEKGTIADVQPMLAVLDRAEAMLGLEVVAALKALNAQALLAHQLKRGTESERERAALALVRIADPRAQDALAEATGDASERVRQRVYEALGRLDDPSAIDVIERGLADPSPDVRCLCADALRRRGAARAVPALRVALAKEEDDLARDYLQRAVETLQAKSE